MHTTFFVLLAAVTIPPITGGLFSYPYQAAVPAFQPSYTYNSVHYPQALARNFPFQPQFGYGFQAGVPIINSIPVSPIAATTVSRVIYSGPQESTKSTAEHFRGFSYQTKYSDGGVSEVVFVTGPESKKLMQQNVELFRTILLQQNKALNESRHQSLDESKSSAPLPTGQSASLPMEDRAQLSAVYRFQLYPAHVSPLSVAPPPLNRIFSSYHHVLGHSLLNTNKQESDATVTENAGDAQESMISEVGAIVAHPKPSEESLVTSDENSLRTSHTKESLPAVQTTEPETASNNTYDKTSPNSSNTSSENTSMLVDQESSTSSTTLSNENHSETLDTTEVHQNNEFSSTPTTENSTEDTAVKQTQTDSNETKESDEKTTLASETTPSA